MLYPYYPAVSTKIKSKLKLLTLLSFSPSWCGNKVRRLWNPEFMLCILRRSFEFAISRLILLSWSIPSPTTPPPWSLGIRESLVKKVKEIVKIYVTRSFLKKWDAPGGRELWGLIVPNWLVVWPLSWVCMDGQVLSLLPDVIIIDDRVHPAQVFDVFHSAMPDSSPFGRCTIQPVNYIWLAVASLVNAIWRWGGDSKQLGVQLIRVWVFLRWLVNIVADGLIRQKNAL